MLIYRGSGLVNFAQGAIGTFAAYLAFVELHGEQRLADAARRSSSRCSPPARSSLAVPGASSCARCAARAAIVRVIATIGLLGLLQAVVAKRYGVGQPAGRLVPARTTCSSGAAYTVQEERLYLVGITLRRHRRRCGRGPATPASAWPSTPAPRTSGRCRRSGWSPDRLAALTWTIGGDARRARRRAGRAAHRAVGDHLHDRRHRRRARRRAARRLPLVPADAASAA